MDDVSDLTSRVSDSQQQQQSAELSERDSDDQPQRALSAVHVKQELVTENTSSAQNGLQHSEEDFTAQDRLQPSELALIMKLQSDMATMQLQLSKLQDTMRTTNTTLQLLMNRTFHS